MAQHRWLLICGSVLLLCGCRLSGTTTAQPLAAAPGSTPAVRIAPVTPGGPLSNPTASPEADAGHLLVERNGCLGCHMLAGRGAAAPGNNLTGLAQRIAGYRTGLSAEAYVRQSLLEPGAFLASGCTDGPCSNVMPSYANRLSEAEIAQITALLLNPPARP